VFADPELARLVFICGSTLVFSGPLQPPLLGAAIASAKIHRSDELDALQRKVGERMALFESLVTEQGLGRAPSGRGLLRQRVGISRPCHGAAPGYASSSLRTTRWAMCAGSSPSSRASSHDKASIFRMRAPPVDDGGVMAKR